MYHILCVPLCPLWLMSLKPLTTKDTKLHKGELFCLTSLQLPTSGYNTNSIAGPKRVKVKPWSATTSTSLGKPFGSWIFAQENACLIWDVARGGQPGY